MDRGPLNKLPKNFVSIFLILIGVAVLAYVGTQYRQMYLEQRHLAEAWQMQQLQASAPRAPNVKYTDNGMVRLQIPKIDLTSFVVEGTNHRALLLGPGHLVNTAQPGEVGNAVISGHRDTFFRHINELEKGDQIFIERGGKKFVYEVTRKKIVEPTEMSVTYPTNDAQMTLITCYPTYYIGPAPKRLVVFSKLKGESEEAIASGAGHVDAAGLAAEQ